MDHDRLREVWHRNRQSADDERRRSFRKRQWETAPNRMLDAAERWRTRGRVPFAEDFALRLIGVVAMLKKRGCGAITLPPGAVAMEAQKMIDDAWRGGLASRARIARRFEELTRFATEAGQIGQSIECESAWAPDANPPRDSMHYFRGDWRFDHPSLTGDIARAAGIPVAAVEGASADPGGAPDIENPGSVDTSVAATAPLDLQHENLFIDEGATWRCRFRGGDQFTIRNTKGARHIAQFLQSQRTPILSVSLQTAANHPSPRRNMVIAADLHDTDDFEKVDGGIARDEVTDPQAIAEIRERAHLASCACREAEQAGRPTEASEAHTELHQLLKQLRTDVGIDGQPRVTPDRHEKARQAVSKAIAATLAEIRMHDPNLASHLDRALVHESRPSRTIGRYDQFTGRSRQTSVARAQSCD